MRTTRLPVRLALAVALLLAGACSDGPTGPHASPGLVTPAAGPLRLAAIACRADLAARRIACGQPSTGTGAAGDLIVGGQNVYIRLASSNLAFIDAPGAAERDTMAVDVTVQNLVPQALGTADGTTVDPAGVRVFFASGPTATAGAGLVSVANADGHATFLGTLQPFFQYSELLPTDAVSSPRRWKMAYEPGVTSFSFTVYVSAVVQYPAGWVDVGPGSLSLAPGQTGSVTATVRTAVGNVVGDDPVTFATSTAAASVAADGTVTGQCGGAAEVGASTATRPARAVTQVTVPPPAFAAFSPDSYSAAGNTIARTADIAASFGYCSVAANGATFVIHSPQTPPGLLGGSYGGAGTGTVVFHHTNPFFPGEEVEATLTAGLLAAPRVARFRMAAGAASGAATAGTYAAGGGTMAVAAGDINGDGRLDLVTANIDANTVSVLLRNAANTGFDAQSYATAAGPISVAVGDLNGDGRLDLAVSHYNVNVVSVLMRNAANTGFDARVDYPAAPAPVSVAVGDLNADGKLDLALANFLAGGISVMMRNAANTGYDARVDYPGGENTNEVAIGDVNGDGLMDVVAAGDEVSSVSVFLRNPSNTGFLPKTVHGTGISPTGLAIGDVNGDGRPDVVAANFEETTVSVLLRNAANTGFDTKVDYTVGGRPRFVAIADVNGDGRLDVAAGNYFEGTLSVLRRNAANTGFDAHVDYPVGSNPRGISISDVNGDGRLDLSVGSYGSGTVVVLTGTP